MPFIDQIAKDRLIEMREALGLTQEGLAVAIRRIASREGWTKPGGHGAVNAFTIRRIEATGHVPSPRVRLVITLFFTIRRLEDETAGKPTLLSALSPVIWDQRNRYEKQVTA